MAFNPANHARLEKAAPKAKISTWQEAKENSIGAQYQAQLKNIKEGKFAVSASGSQKQKNYIAPKYPSSWVMEKGKDYYICWRIMNKPIFWTEEDKQAENGWLKVNGDPETMLTEIRDYIVAGNADDLIEEAFNRPRKKRKDKDTRDAERLEKEFDVEEDE